jgi:thioredoxin 1
MKKIFLILVFVFSLVFGHDFGDVPEKIFSQIDKTKPCMVMVGKTHCIWCESMAPQIKEIKEEYPKTIIYYVNTDKDMKGAMREHILELPVQIFYKDGKEVDRHIGYMGKADILEYLEKYGILAK